jgi:hypothetical protein
MSDEQKIIELLQSGDFTIAYHDNGSCCLYKGKYTYDELPEEEDFGFDMNEHEIGYAPAIVVHLVRALKGNIDSI